MAQQAAAVPGVQWRRLLDLVVPARVLEVGLTGAHFRLGHRKLRRLLVVVHVELLLVTVVLVLVLLVLLLRRWLMLGLKLLLLLLLMLLKVLAVQVGDRMRVRLVHLVEVVRRVDEGRLVVGLLRVGGGRRRIERLRLLPRLLTVSRELGAIGWVPGRYVLIVASLGHDGCARAAGRRSVRGERARGRARGELLAGGSVRLARVRAVGGALEGGPTLGRTLLGGRGDVEVVHIVGIVGLLLEQVAVFAVVLLVRLLLVLRRRDGRSVARFGLQRVCCRGGRRVRVVVGGGSCCCGGRSGRRVASDGLLVVSRRALPEGCLVRARVARGCWRRPASAAGRARRTG